MKKIRYARTVSWIMTAVCTVGLLLTGTARQAGAVAGDEQIYTAGVPPMVLMVMGRDHKLYYEAYNDASDLNEDGTLDVGYKPEQITYYGYFDSYKCYNYDATDGRFEPVSATANKRCTGTNDAYWSGDFLNYATMTRMDCLRKVLYGGYRSTDTDSLTVLQRSYIPQDAHSFGKEYFTIAYDGYDIREYTPLSLPAAGMRHLFASTTHEDGGTGGTNGPDLNRPLLRVLPSSAHRIWQWVAKERPVVDNSLNRTTAGGGVHPGHPDDHAEFQDLILDYATEANRFTGGPTPAAVLLTIGGPAPTRSLEGNPFGNDYNPYTNGAVDQQNYLSVMRSYLHIHRNIGSDGIDNDNDGTTDEPGEQMEVEVSVDGDDAVEVVIGGDPLSGGSGTVIGYYGAHGSCNCNTHSQVLMLDQGSHSLEFHHEEAGGGDNYSLRWRRRIAGGAWGAWAVIPSAGTVDGLDNDGNGVIDQGGIDFNGDGTMDVCDEPITSGLGPIDWRTYRLLTPITPASIAEDYVVKVVVGDASIPESSDPEHFKRYPHGNYKPIGLLQRHGEDGRMKFGLLTGSYAKNTSGGVLRKAIGYITDEIDLDDGTFTSTVGIIKTLDRLRITGFTYSDYSYNQNCGWIANAPIAEGQCRMWGNPVAEMMYEGLRYFAGKSGPLAAYNYTATGSDDAALGLPKVDSWTDPFNSANYCAKPFMLVLSDIYPTFDSNQLPGSAFNTYTTSGADLADLDVAALGNTIHDDEIDDASHFIGQAGTDYAGNCFPKTVDSFGNIRGLCPEEPTKQGSYYAASVAWFGRNKTIHSQITTTAGTQKDVPNVLTYTVAMASPLPRINIPVGGGNITLVPFAKSVAGDYVTSDTTATPDDQEFQPTNTIVDFFVEKITPSYGKFRINYEDVEQGADHDMDAIVEYIYEVVDETGTPYCDPAAADFDTCTPDTDATRVRITLNSIYAAGSIQQHMGYVISGTAPDAAGNATVGTYLEVRDIDTSAAADYDYFLDTPPGRLPGEVLTSGTPAWDDNTALPLETSRIFTVGAEGTAATLLKDPLWYAAKWGGFEDVPSATADPDDDKKPDLATEWDLDGNEVPDTYFYVVNPLKLEQQLNQSFASILSRGVSHVAPVVSVDEANRTQSGNRVFMAFFKPLTDDYWQGNLKKYGIEYLQRADCGLRGGEPFTDANSNGQYDTGESFTDSNGNLAYDMRKEWTVVDKNGAIAVDCDGKFKTNSVSYWSGDRDGGEVSLGGAGGLLKSRIDAVTLPTSGPFTGGIPFYNYRNIFTYDSSKADPAERMVRFCRDVTSGQCVMNADNADDVITPAMLGLTTTDYLERDKIINFIYGYTYAALDGAPAGTYDGSLDGAPMDRRDWILGDLIHSEPTIIDYLDADFNTQHRFVVIGGNDGMLHVFIDEVEGVTGSLTVGGVAYAAGTEIWAFIPEDLLPRLKEFAATGHRYFVDGSCSLHRGRIRTDGWLDQTLVFGERRGGRSYWALDVTKPDPAQWAVKWHAGHTTTGFTELGQTWSRPIFGRIQTGESSGDPVYTEVAIFGGGYDPEEDNYPENYDDDNENGLWNSGEAFTDSNSNGTYDYHNLDGMNEMGRAFYVVQLSDGDILFSSNYAAADSSTPPSYTRSLMKWSVPADPTVVDFGRNVAGDDLVIYQADIYGQIWKASYDYSRTGNDKWQLWRVFNANPGSNQVNSGGTFILSPLLVPADRGRKTFYSPDVSYFGSDWTDFPVLFFGTGDREHPRYLVPNAKNRFYSVSDPFRFGVTTPDTGDERFLLNLTCNELDVNGDTNQNGTVQNTPTPGDHADTDIQNALRDILYGVTNYGPDNDARGWFRILADQGNCTQDNFDHTGESVLSMPILFFGNVYFTSYQPVFGDPCNPYGNAFAYALGYSYGTAGLDLNKDNSTTGTLEDSYQVITETSIPSSVRILIRGDDAAGLISTGGSVVGAGEEGEGGTGHSTTIPGQPGGIQMIQWRTN